MTRPGRPRADTTDYDEVLVRRIITGERRGEPIRPADVVEIVRRMAAAGYSDGQIAYRIGYHARSILRIRKDHNIAAAYPSRGCNNYHLRHPEAPTRRDRTTRARDARRERTRTS